MINNIYQTLQKLKAKQQPRIQAKYIYLDEQTKQIKETKLDSAGATAHINTAKLIHRFMFGC